MKSVESFWKPSFDPLYDASFQKFASESVLARWAKVHNATAKMAALAASSSAISGWVLRSESKGKIFWVSLAAAASGLSILHSAPDDNSYGSTLLHEAAAAGQTGVAKLLLASGADVNAADNQGRTPLSAAASRKQTGLANLLRP